jgi:hypothetical protein
MSVQCNSHNYYDILPAQKVPVAPAKSGLLAGHRAWRARMRQ